MGYLGHPSFLRRTSSLPCPLVDFLRRQRGSYCVDITRVIAKFGSFLRGSWKIKATGFEEQHWQAILTGFVDEEMQSAGDTEARMGGGTWNKAGDEAATQIICGACFTIQKLQKRENRTEQANNSKFELLEQFATDRKTTRPIGTMC